MRTITFTGKLVVVGACSECGSNQAIPERLYEQASHYGRNFYCSSCGASQIFTQTEVARLRADLAREEGRVAMLRRDLKVTEDRRRGEKAAKTRLKNRIAKGVCPSCKRHFSNVQRHITSQHPEFVDDGLAPAGGTDA